MPSASPTRRFEAALDRALFVWCFDNHHSDSAKNAAARILMDASEWSPVAKDAMIRTLEAEESFGWFRGIRYFWQHLIAHWWETPLVQMLIRSHHLHTWGVEGWHTYDVFTELKSQGLWSRSSWETVRRAACWNHGTILYGRYESGFRGYALTEIAEWSKDVEAIPCETELKAAYWVWIWESKTSVAAHFYVPEGAVLSDYSTEWDSEGFLASWPPPKQKYPKRVPEYLEDVASERHQDWEWVEMVWESSAYPALLLDSDGNCPATLAARDPRQREALLAQFGEDILEHRQFRRKLARYFDLVDARFQPERTEPYRRLLLDPESKLHSFSTHSRELQLVLWWPEHPETKPFFITQVQKCMTQEGRYELKYPAQASLMWLALTWPEDPTVRQLVREALSHPCHGLAETAAGLLRFCHQNEADYLPLLQEQRHRGQVFFHEYLLAASPDLEAMQLALQTLESLKGVDGNRSPSECGASILVQAYGPRKDLLTKLREIARDSANPLLQKDIVAVLQRWLPLSFGSGLTCIVPIVRLEAIDKLAFNPENEARVRDMMAHDESLMVRHKAATWLCSHKPGTMPLAELLPLVKEDDAGGSQLLHHWAGLHPQAVREVLEFGPDALFTAPCPRLTLLVSQHYALVEPGEAYLAARMAEDTTDEERNAIFTGFVAKASQAPDAKERLLHLVAWLEAPWMESASAKVYCDAILPLIDPGNQLPWLLSLAEKLPREGKTSSFSAVMLAIMNLPGKEGYQQATPQAVVIVEWLTKQLQDATNPAIRFTAVNSLLFGFFSACASNTRRMHPVYSAAMDALNLHHGWGRQVSST